MTAPALAAAGRAGLDGPGLSSILARGDVWRGDVLARLPAPAVPTGYVDLDKELPGGGWPPGCLTELLHAGPGIGEVGLLLPALARLSAEGGWLALVAPPWMPHAPAWQAAGLVLERLVVVQAGKEAPWCCEQLLLSGGFAAVLGWLGAEAGDRQLRRLQVAAEGQSTLACVWRPARAATASSPAALRLVLEPAVGGLNLRILKRRGRPASRPLYLAVPRPGRLPRALARPSLSVPAPRSPVRPVAV